MDQDGFSFLGQAVFFSPAAVFDRQLNDPSFFTKRVERTVQRARSQFDTAYLYLQ